MTCGKAAVLAKRFLEVGDRACGLEPLEPKVLLCAVARRFADEVRTHRASVALHLRGGVRRCSDPPFAPVVRFGSAAIAAHHASISAGVLALKCAASATRCILTRHIACRRVHAALAGRLSQRADCGGTTPSRTAAMRRALALNWCFGGNINLVACPSC